MPEIKETEIEVLEQAVEAMQRETGARLEIVRLAPQVGRMRLDAELRLHPGGKQLFAEVKKWAPQANLGALINQIREFPVEGILVADYINPNMAAELRAQQVQFIDAVGNAYINQPGMYVYVKGNKEKKNQFRPTKDGTKRAFEPKGLIVVYALLCQAYLTNAPYREIAARAGVAVGTVGWVINALKAGNFIRDAGHGGGRQLMNTRKLLDRWIEAWPEKLKPKFLVGEFEAGDPNWWKHVDITKYDGYWGGEVAAAKYTNYLQPEEVTVYIPVHGRNRFLADMRLRKVNDWRAREGARVHVYKPFWPKVEGYLENEYWENEGLAHPILVYADLIATGDVRNLEVAKRLYEEHITQFDWED